MDQNLNTPIHCCYLSCSCPVAPITCSDHRSGCFQTACCTSVHTAVRLTWYRSFNQRIRREILANNHLDALFHVFIYFISLYVSRITVLIIRRSNFINTSSGMISLCKWLLGTPVRREFSSLYMFRASRCSSSGDRILLIHHLVWLVCVSDCLVCRSGGNFHPSTCFEHHSAHHQEIELY